MRKVEVFVFCVKEGLCVERIDYLIDIENELNFWGIRERKRVIRN